MARRRARQEPYVSLYRHELECEAYRSLSTDARALLVEFRALYRGQENRVLMTVGEIRKRLCGVGQERAVTARDELVDRGSIRLTVEGSFHRKSRLAAEYALLNEPLENKDGATAPKDYMKWKSTVLKTSTVGTRDKYRGDGETAEKHPHGTRNKYRQHTKTTLHGTQNEYTDKLPRSAGLLMGTMVVKSEAQYKLILASLALMTGEKR